MPKVTNPAPGANKSDSTFEWDMEGVNHISSKVIVGSTEGSDNIYAGTAFSKGTTKDNNVVHPRNGQTCFTRVKFKKQFSSTWWTTNSLISDFTSVPGS